MKNKTTAAVLALFLGGSIGAHKFYLGRGGWGLIYLLFCWTFIPTVVSLIEFIMLLSMSEHDFNLQYNPGVALPGGNPHQIVVNVQNTAHAGQWDTAGKLRELHELKVAGALTEDEFQQQKMRLLSGA